MLENLLISIRCVTPIILCLFVGILVRRTGTLSDESLKQANKFLFAFLLPQYLFYNTYTADFSTDFSPRLVIFSVALISLFFWGSLFVLHRRGYSKREIGAMSQNAYRSNINIIALPLAESLLGAQGLAMMAILSAFVTPLYNFYAVTTLEMHREGGKVNVKQILLGIVKNQIVIGTMLGFLFNFAKIRLPDVVLSSVSLMGRAGTTMTLILLGASFRFGSLVSDRKRIIGGNLYRLAAAPLIAFLLALAVGIRGNELAMVVLTMGSPLATVCFTMCQAYDSDADLAAELIVTTSTLCCFSLFLWIFLLKQLGVV